MQKQAGSDAAEGEGGAGAAAAAAAASAKASEVASEVKNATNLARSDFAAVGRPGTNTKRVKMVHTGIVV